MFAEGREAKEEKEKGGKRFQLHTGERRGGVLSTEAQKAGRDELKRVGLGRWLRGETAFAV